MRPGERGKRPVRVASKLSITKVAAVDAGAGKGVTIQLWKRRDAVTRKAMGLEEIISAFNALSPEDKQKACDALGMKMDMGEKQDAGPSAEAKRLSPEAKAELEKRDVELAKLRADNEKRDTEIAKLRDDASQRDTLEEVRKRWASAPGDESKIATLVRKVRGKLDKDDAAELERILTSVSEVIAKSSLLTQQLGSARGKPSEGETAEEKLQSIAKKLGEEKEYRGKSPSQLFLAAAEQNKDLYAQYSAEKKARS